MAQRRMLSRQVLYSDGYVDLSLEAKAFYPYLVLEADDDGFVNNVGSLCRAAVFGMEVVEELLHAGFLIRFDSGVLVVAHWKAQNKVQPTRRVPTRFAKEMALLEADQTGCYRLRQLGVSDSAAVIGDMREAPGEEIHNPENLCPVEEKPKGFALCPVCRKLSPLVEGGMVSCKACKRLFKPKSGEIIGLVPNSRESA